MRSFYNAGALHLFLTHLSHDTRVSFISRFFSLASFLHRALDALSQPRFKRFVFVFLSRATYNAAVTARAEHISRERFGFRVTAVDELPRLHGLLVLGYSFVLF